MTSAASADPSSPRAAPAGNADGERGAISGAPSQTRASPLALGSADVAAGLRLAACLLFGLVILGRGWLCDDAFISLRSVDHLVAGRGLVFNVGERVQSFTNPLWVLLLAVPHALLHEPYAVLLVSGLVVSLAGCWVLGWVIAPTPLAGALGLALLAASEAYGDFSTSGLENPLSHLLVLGTLAFFLHPARRQPRPWAPWLCAGLALTTRLDNGVLLACTLAVLALQQYDAERLVTSARRALRRVIAFAAIGLAPLVAWELFALVYYGALVPNTALAKLAVNIPRPQLLGQGVVYLLTSLQRDPLTPLVIATGIAFGMRARALRPVAAGILLHLLYVIAVGGDFMAGRFLTVPMTAAVALIVQSLGTSAAHHDAHQDLREPQSSPAQPPFHPHPSLSRGALTPHPGKLWPLFAAAIVVVAILSPYDPFAAGGPRTIPATGIVSERDFYRPELGILRNLRTRAYQTHGFWQDGLAFRRGDRRVVVHDNAGLTAYAAGPDRHLIDGAGLTDPLLARVPFPYRRDWRVGHYERPLPTGYRETLETGQNRIEDPHYRELYERIRLVTRGPLLSRERWRAIYELHAGSFSAARKASP